MERIWQKHYEKEVAGEIDITRFNSLIELLEHSCSEAGDRVAFSNMGCEVSFKTFLASSRSFAAWLIHHLGIKKGDRVAIMMPNLLQYPVALFGILQAGGVVVNINPLYTASEVAHVLNDSGARAIVLLDNFANVLEKALPDINLDHIILTGVGDMFSAWKKSIVNFVVKYIKNGVPKYDLPNIINFGETLRVGQGLPLDNFKMQREDTAFLQYTGGTTGVSKGAMLSHGNMLANMLQIMEWTKEACKGEQQIMITPLPLYHILSLTGNLLLCMVLKAKNVLITNPRDSDGLIKELKRHKFTAIIGVNTLFNSLLNHPKIHQVDFSRAKLAVAGGMAVQKSVADRWRVLTGYPIIEGYGLTEASPVVCINPLNVTSWTGSVGLPVPSTDAEIRNEDGSRAKIGESGELYVKGPQVMRQYWNRPEETKNIFSEDGWLKTGDIAKMDAEGFFYIVDRKKDLIIVSGFNVFPNEVEEVIAHNPGVLEVAVIGVPYEKSGEAVKAFVVKKNPGLTEADVLGTCHKYLTGYKVPKIVEFRDSLPKSNVGKILRRSLRE